MYNSVGFTSVCSGGGRVADLQAFQALRDKEELSVRIFHNITLPLDGSKPHNELVSEIKALGLKTGDGDEWVKVGALKVVLDGGMLTGTAFLHEGWGKNAKALYGISDPAYRGELMYTKDQLINIISSAFELGWKFTAHVTGGGGVDTLLAAYEAVHDKTPVDKKRFSVIHGNFFTDSAIAKMARMHVYADMQPAWFFKDTDLLHQVLGAERLRSFHRYRSLVEAGVIVNAGSDHMVKTDPDLSINPYNPFTAIWSVVTRKTDRGTVHNPEEAVSREDALKMYTINNAYASFEESVKGSVEAGKFADLVVLSNDLLTCPVDSIKNIRPLMTILNGKIVYDRGQLTSLH
jgi:predicted amidohydrolase YtcJ